MEYKICESCGAKLHVRTLKCPICNVLLTDASKIITDVAPIINLETPNETYPIPPAATLSHPISEQNDINELVTPPTHIETSKDEKIETTQPPTPPMSNLYKVFLSVICTIPFIGQLMGTFIGTFYATYEEKDRNSFGKVLIFLSILMFSVYFYALTFYSDFLQNVNLFIK